MNATDTAALVAEANAASMVNGTNSMHRVPEPCLAKLTIEILVINSGGGIVPS